MAIGTSKNISLSAGAGFEEFTGQDNPPPNPAIGKFRLFIDSHGVAWIIDHTGNKKELQFVNL